MRTKVLLGLIIAVIICSGFLWITKKEPQVVPSNPDINRSEEVSSSTSEKEFGAMESKAVDSSSSIPSNVPVPSVEDAASSSSSSSSSLPGKESVEAIAPATPKTQPQNSSPSKEQQIIDESKQNSSKPASKGPKIHTSWDDLKPADKKETGETKGGGGWNNAIYG